MTARRAGPLPHRPATALAALLLSCAACPAPRPPEAPGPSAAAPARPDAGWALTAAQLEAWLAVQRALPAPRRADGGAAEDPRARARAEQAVLLDAGLSAGDLDRVEDLVSVFVTQRNVERLSGGAAASQFQGALGELSTEERLKAEAAFAEAAALAAPSPLPALEARFGPEAVRLLLAREPELTRAWDSLLEGR
jgi:hypothetical protein